MNKIYNMKVNVNVHPKASQPMQNRIKQLAESKFQEVNYKSGNHVLPVSHLGQVFNLEMIAYTAYDGYQIDVLNHLFK